MSPSNDDDLIAQVRRAAQDPETRDRLLREINAASGTGTSLGTLGSTLGTIGNAMSKTTATNPRQAGVNSLGAGLGAGIGLLIRGKKNPATGTNRGYGNTQIPSDTTTETVGSGPMGTGGSSFTGVQPPSPAITPQSLSGAASQLRTGTDKYGNSIHSTDNGTTWVDDSGRAAAGPVYGEVNTGVPEGMRSGGRTAFARGGAVVVTTPPAPSKKGVLLRRPAAVPVLSTTIVIGKKKPEKPEKPGKKKGGGPIRPLKPAAVPPRHGPGDGDAQLAPPAPFKKGGRVQIPRGSGCATRGKRFGGIY